MKRQRAAARNTSGDGATGRVAKRAAVLAETLRLQQPAWMDHGATGERLLFAYGVHVERTASLWATVPWVVRFFWERGLFT